MSGGGLKTWLLAARPKTLWAGVAPVMMGTAMAYDDGGFHAGAALCALLGAVFIQIGANYANDYFDFVKGADTAERVGPLRATQAGLVTPAQMRMATALTFAMAILAGLYLVYRGGWPILAIGLVSIACGILYTGGPFPLGYLGLGDCFVLVFFGPVAVAGTYYVQTLQLTAPPVIAGLAPGFFSVALLTVNNLRDIEGDAKAGKKTLAVRLGPGFARAEYIVSLVIACAAVPLWLVLETKAHPWALVSMAVLLAGIPAMRAVFRVEGAELNKTLAATGKLLLIFAVIFSIGWLR